MDENVNNARFRDGSFTDNPHDSINCEINLNKRWKYISTDIENTISLHDCVINSWGRNNGDIIMIFRDGFNVSESNPQNNTGRNLNTGSAEVRLTAASFVGASTSKQDSFNYNDVMLSSKPAEKLDINYEDYDCEVINWRFDQEKHSFYFNGDIFGQIPRRHTNLEFSCLNVIYCWNEYRGDSWIEGYKKSKSINELFCRLGFIRYSIAGNINGIPHGRTFYIYPGCDTAYCFNNMSDCNGVFYIIKTAQNLNEAEKNNFLESVRYPESLTARELTAEVERWLKKSAGITL